MEKYSLEEMVETVIKFHEIMCYVDEERADWYSKVGKMNEALSDVYHAVENNYNGDKKQGDMFTKVLYTVTKERRKYKDIQELLLPVLNAYKDTRTENAIENMIKYKGIIDSGRKYSPKVLTELFEQE